MQVYDAPTPTRTNLTVLPGTTASLRGITGDAGPLLKTEYAGDLQEWELTLGAGVPSINTGISEMCASSTKLGSRTPRFSFCVCVSPEMMSMVVKLG